MIPPDRAAAVEISPELHRTEQRRRRWSESPMTRDDVVLAFRTSLADGGWPVEWADEVADENLEIAAELPARHHHRSKTGELLPARRAS